MVGPGIYQRAFSYGSVFFSIIIILTINACKKQVGYQNSSFYGTWQLVEYDNNDTVYTATDDFKEIITFFKGKAYLINLYKGMQLAPQQEGTYWYNQDGLFVNVGGGASIHIPALSILGSYVHWKVVSLSSRLMVLRHEYFNVRVVYKRLY